MPGHDMAAFNPAQTFWAWVFLGNKELAAAMAKMDAMPGDLVAASRLAWGLGSPGILHLPRHGKVSEERVAREESLRGK